jgi:hypothetical protein
MYQIGKWGKVFDDGKYFGWYVLIDNNTHGSTGGYYIYLVKDPEDKNSEGYDNWVENEEFLNQFMDNNYFQIDWNLSINSSE